MTQNDRNKRLCINTQMREQLESVKAKGLLKVRKFKRPARHFKTLGEALAARTSGS